jgi:nitrile hydratase
MDGIHDLGGRQGFGPIPRGEAAERAFSADWQRRVFGMAALANPAHSDAFRHAIERLPPVTYLTVGYWGRWLGALELLQHENDARVRRDPTQGPTRELQRAPRFRVGERVRVRDLHTSGHTRLPGYVRGRRGVVALSQGGWVYPDTHAHARGDHPQHVYAVRFEARELWGDTAEPGSAVHVDLFEPYLEPDLQ